MRYTRAKMVVKQIDVVQGLDSDDLFFLLKVFVILLDDIIFF
jgi:hypothetical protein